MPQHQRSQHLRTRYYVGARINKDDTTRHDRYVFTSSVLPTSASHGDRYIYVIGPFRTKAGAIFMANFGANNPHCQCVDDAERLAFSPFCQDTDAVDPYGRLR